MRRMPAGSSSGHATRMRGSAFAGAPERSAGADVLRSRATLHRAPAHGEAGTVAAVRHRGSEPADVHADRKSTRLNSSHSQISYAVFCLKKKKKKNQNK